jgi:hypothetical protein
MAGMRDAFKKGGGTTAPEAGSVRPSKKKPKVPKPPKDKGRGKRKLKITFNSPKTTKVTYG